MLGPVDATGSGSRKRRPRNAQATRGLLLDAAEMEFSEHGFAGGRIDRIAERAGVNKRLIYLYFGDKDGLFGAVLGRHIESVMDRLPLDDGDLVAFAAARFDYMLANPRVARLATWRLLERAEPTVDELRSFKTRLATVAAAQRDGLVRSDIPAVDLFAIVLRMSDSWLSAPSALKAAVRGDPMSPRRLREHRGFLLAAVRSVTQPA